MSRGPVIFATVFAAIFWPVVIVMGVRGLTGCQSADVVTIPRAPAWILPRDPNPVTGYQVRAEAARLAPLARLTLRDDAYTRVSRAWLDRYCAWTWEATRATGIRYVPESFDCENFAGLFAEIARSKAAAAGQTTAPLIAVVVLTADGGRRHAMVAVATDEGVFVVEPQPDAGPFRVKPLADYAGRILEVEL